MRRVLQQAFGRAASEADLVHALRASSASVPDLCLVALDDEDIVGHLFFSRARLDSGDDVLALAPMAVLPERQGEGIGSRLLKDGLRRATETAFPLIVVVGHATYYRASASRRPTPTASARPGTTLASAGICRHAICSCRGRT